MNSRSKPTKANQLIVVQHYSRDARKGSELRRGAQSARP
jgi:hypothetical protein